MIDTHLHKSRQTAKLGLIKLTRDLFPGESLKTAYSMQDGVYCCFTNSTMSVREVRQMEKALKEWVLSDPDIELIDRERGYYYYKLEDGIIAEVVYPCETNTSKVEPFTMIPYSDGFIIDFGGQERDKSREHPDKLYATYEKTQNWLKKINIELIGDVNKYIVSGESYKLLGIAEALQEKEMAEIADLVLQQRRALRLLLISGPSSAGKTSFTQRLSTQLRVNGLNPVPLSLDDYFVNREDTPLDEEGKPDFERLEAIDLPLMRDQIGRLIEGEGVDTPIFDFPSGRRSDKTRRIQVGPDEILVIEGIHALNHDLLPQVHKNTMFKIYLNALFEVNIDLHNRIPASEVRLIRRLVRGDLFRGTSPEETLEQWANVRKGEYKYIFKFQEEADVMFNSSLLYEMNALRPLAEKTLRKIPNDSVHYATKSRLLNLLTFCEPMDVSKVPFNSILREFIGGSIYFDGP